MATAAEIRKTQGPEAADAYMQQYRDANEARAGIRYTGPDKSQEKALAIEKLVDADAEAKGLKFKRSILFDKKDPASLQKIKDIDARLEEIRVDKSKNVPKNLGVTAVAPDAPVGGKLTPTPSAILALKENPSMRGEFEAFYGPGSAAKYLGK
jgi:hypothetical protein